MGELVSYPDHAGPGEGYLAIPSSGATSPAVIVLPEQWGIVPHITSVADRFAEAGFVALVPDLSPTSEDGPVTGRRLDDAARLVAEAADHLAARPEVTGKVGTVGFCVGGSLALWSAGRSDRIVAAAGFYPSLPWDGLGVDRADYAGKTAVIHCAENSGAATPDGVRATRQAIEAAGGTCQTYDYPGTGHAFFNDDRPEAFDRQAAASAWARTLELFRSRLG
ncbi:dienelactone hydrolase [Micromonospora rosaria]|uniref:Dienelactone hydrolase n=1 Tax=Micromonospora rosaria TaxID=47874 RepID=A0A136PT08_9ACTN|nr:dienelactone hydrolase family protein [Micromonospora rosaria]KXK61631.1 dienelactone hydrolase [Micromonospora rosaria]